MEEQINYNLTQLSTWKRIFFMLIFAAIGSLVRMLIWAVIILQVASTLLTGKANQNILNFGRSLAVYTYHILLFLTFKLNAGGMLNTCKSNGSRPSGADEWRTGE